jgi:hypothetical protein
MKITDNELRRRLDAEDPHAIMQLIEMRTRRKEFEDRRRRGGKRRYTKKIHFRSKLHKNTRKSKKKSTKKSKKYKKKYNKN